MNIQNIINKVGKLSHQYYFKLLFIILILLVFIILIILLLTKYNKCNNANNKIEGFNNEEGYFNTDTINKIVGIDLESLMIDKETFTTLNTTMQNGLTTLNTTMQSTVPELMINNSRLGNLKAINEVTNTKLDTIDTTMQNALTRLNTTMQTQNRNLKSAYVTNMGNISKPVVVTPCKVYSIYYGFPTGSSGILALYDSNTEVTSNATPTYAMIMRREDSGNLTFGPGGIVFNNGVVVRGLEGYSTSNTKSINSSLGVTIIYEDL